MSNDQVADWRGHPALQTYIEACRNSAPMGRTLLLLWHHDVQAFNIFDRAHGSEAALLGWTVVGYASAGTMQLAPRIDVTHHDEGGSMTKLTPGD